MVSRREGRKRAGRGDSAPLPATRDTQLAEPVLPGWPERFPERLDWMRDSLERVAFTRAEVVGLWSKALRKLQDAMIDGVSTDTALETAYAAGRIGAVAVLASRHIRITARTGHHEKTFAAAQHLGIPGLEELQFTSSEVRSDRRDADYAPEEATAEQVAHAIKWARQILPAMRTALTADDPVLAEYLAPSA